MITLCDDLIKYFLDRFQHAYILLIQNKLINEGVIFINDYCKNP